MIALCPNPFRDHELRITRKLDRMLREEGFETSICPVFAELFARCTAALSRCLESILERRDL